MPETDSLALMGFAHDQQLRSGLLADSVVASKDLMIQPNAPRLPARGR